MKIRLWEQLVLNILPVVGYWFLDWSMFSILYIYWFEAVFIAFFYVLEKLFSRGEDVTGYKASFVSRCFSSFKLLLIRWGVMLFYWVFILVFVALGMGKNNSEQSLENLKVIVFMDPGFNIALLSIFLNGVLHFMRDFIMTGKYLVSSSGEYKSVFDARTIIIHVVIVLGTFAFQFLSSYSYLDGRLPGLAYVLILCLLKCIADVLSTGKNKGETAFKAK